MEGCEDALAPFKSFVQSMTFRYDGQNYETYRATNEHGRSIRLDFESFLPAGPQFSTNPPYSMKEHERLHVIDLMFEQIQFDLEDIIENGDTRSDDALLRYVDGEKKLGKSCTELTINSGICFQEFKPTKDSFEYTIILNISLEWE